VKTDKPKENRPIKTILKSSRLPILEEYNSCNFYGYDVESLMKETSQLKNIITKRGTMEILIPLCCSAVPVRYIAFRKSKKGFSSITLTIRFQELEKSGILNRKSFNEIPPRV
jgi:DNA-binding HxlR family transcriptional regulator